MHYRRFFLECGKKSTSPAQDIISRDRIISILRNHEVIVPFPAVKVKDYARLYKNTPLEQQKDQNMVILDRIIQRWHPDEYQSWEKTVYGKTMIFGNMLIARRKVFDEYSEWLFDVLARYDDCIKESGEERVPRMDGFLSELLLKVWLDAHYSGRDIYYMEARNIEANSFPEYGTGIKSKFARMIRSNRNILVHAKKMQLIASAMVKR